MKEEIIEFIDRLANKFGTTTEQLWTILIKQARIVAMIQLTFIVIVLSIGLVLFGIHKVLSHPYPLFRLDTSVTYTYYDRYAYNVIIPFGFAITTWAVFLIVALKKISNIITGICNPEYWALNDIGRRFGKG